MNWAFVFPCSAAFCRILYVCFVCSIAFTWTATFKIFIFVLEDFLNIQLPAEDYSFLGRTYARNVSWVLLAGSITVLLTWLQKNIEARLPRDGIASFRRRLLEWTGCLTFLWLVVHAFYIVYAYFSGASKPLEPFYSALSFVGFGCFFGFILWELFEKPHARRHKVKIVASAVALFSVFAISSTMVYAPPSYMRIVQSDLQKIYTMEDTIDAIKDWYKTDNDVPDQDAYNALLLQIPSLSAAGISYTKMSADTFNLCATFTLHSKHARRALTSLGVRYEPGRHCVMCTLKKSENGLVKATLKHDKGVHLSVRMFRY